MENYFGSFMRKSMWLRRRDFSDDQHLNKSNEIFWVKHLLQPLAQGKHRFSASLFLICLTGVGAGETRLYRSCYFMPGAECGSQSGLWIPKEGGGGPGPSSQRHATGKKNPTSRKRLCKISWSVCSQSNVSVVLTTLKRTSCPLACFFHKPRGK